MRPAKRTRTRTRSVTAKVTPEHELLLKKRAQSLGMTISEYARQTILGSLDASSETQMIVSELMALRKIFLLLKIDSYEGKKLTEQRLRLAVDQAEATKHAMASSRISSFWAQQKGEAEEPRKDG